MRLRRAPVKRDANHGDIVKAFQACGAFVGAQAPIVLHYNTALRFSRALGLVMVDYRNECDEG